MSYVHMRLISSTYILSDPNDETCDTFHPLHCCLPIPPAREEQQLVDYIAGELITSWERGGHG
jgi:hypothetical protein